MENNRLFLDKRVPSPLIWGLNNVLRKLKHKNRSYIVVSQLPNKNPSVDKWERKVTEIFTQ